MLGYILAALDEYGPASLFDGNSFTFKLITNKNVEGRWKLDYEDFEVTGNDAEGSVFEAINLLYDESFRWWCVLSTN